MGNSLRNSSYSGQLCPSARGFCRISLVVFKVSLLEREVFLPPLPDIGSYKAPRDNLDCDRRCINKVELNCTEYDLYDSGREPKM